MEKGVLDEMRDESIFLRYKAAAAALLGALTALWGWFGWLAVVWTALMLADWLVGSAVAARQGRWSSEGLRTGAWHKGGQIVVVGVALVTDWLIGTLLENLPGVTLPFAYGVLLGPLVIVWYVIGELGSLAEHAVSMGAPVPGWLPGILELGRSAVDRAGAAAGRERPAGGGEGGPECEHPEDGDGIGYGRGR